MAKKAEKKSLKKAAKMTVRNTKHKAAESRVTRPEDGSLPLTNEHGTARISRTPPDARVPLLRPWTLEINETVKDTCDIEEQAITEAKEILAWKP
jgi:hypothetical protein